MTEPSSLREVGALVHILHRRGGDVEVVALHLAGRRLRAVHRFHAVQEAIAPVHERLRVDVLVVLREVETALQRFVNDAPVVLAGQAELGLHGRAEQRPAEFVEPLALDDDARRRPCERLHVGDRETHVLEAQRLERLEAEHVADDRCGQIRDRAGLEQIEVVGDVREVLAGRARHGLDPVGLGAIAFARGEPVCPHDRPGRGRRLTGDCGCGLLRIDAFLRRDPEEREDVGVLRFVVAVPVAHLGVLEYAGAISRRLRPWECERRFA